MRNGYGRMADGTRKLVVGQEYKVHGIGFEYMVGVDALLPADEWSDNNAIVTSIGGWQMIIHGYHVYDDDYTIDWDYSTGGRFVYEEVKNV